MRIEKVWFLGAFLVGLVLTLGACNTIQGAGKDLSAAGDAVSDTAEDVQDDM